MKLSPLIQKMLVTAPSLIVVPVLAETVRPAYVDVTPERCDRTGQTVRQRKFPGPAGLLPDKVGDAC